MSTRSSIKSEPFPSLWVFEAISMARQATALAHPNPRVGAIVVKDGRKVGEGFHTYEGRDHAEIIALRAAGARARGATLYVSLEPCCIIGRTAPCTDAIIAAGIKRVYAAIKDPNPRVSGRGLARLKKAGIEVHLSESEKVFAQETNEDFAKWIRTGLPFITLKTALTLDGQISEGVGSVTRITSKPSRDCVQRLRHGADALLTGIGTVRADDPRLTDRTGQPRRRPLLRAVVDSRLRMPLKSKLVKSADCDLVIFTTQSLDSKKARALIFAGAEVVRLPAKRGHVDLRAVARELGQRQMLNVVLEAGADLNGAALQAGIVDKMILFYAPKIMGTGGVPMARIPSRWFANSPALQNIKLDRSGTDFVVQGYFHDVYRDHRTRR